MATKSHITLAHYLEQQLALSDRTQMSIAEEMGYANPNVLTMIKHGRTKLPINKVAALAKALNIDATHLLKLTLLEYSPELWEMLEQIFGKAALVTQEEVKLLSFVHETIGGVLPDIENAQNRKELADTLAAIAARDNAKNDAAIDNIDRSGWNARVKSA